MNTCTNITPLYGLKDSPDMEEVCSRPDYLVYDALAKEIYPFTGNDGHPLGVTIPRVVPQACVFCCPYEIACNLSGQEQVDEIIRWASHFESL